METYLISLLYRNIRTSCVSLAKLGTQRSHDTLRRVLYSRIPWSRRLWAYLAVQVVGAGGYVVIEDTSWQRFTKVAQAVSWVWSSTAGKPVWGMQVVLLLWTDGQRKGPVGMRFWRAGERSKVELASRLTELRLGGTG